MRDGSGPVAPASIAKKVATALGKLTVYIVLFLISVLLSVLASL